MADARFRFENEARQGAAGGYTSEFSEVDEEERKSLILEGVKMKQRAKFKTDAVRELVHQAFWRDDKLSGIRRKSNCISGLPSKRSIVEEYEREEAKTHRFHVLSLDAFSRHKLYINNYLRYYGGSMEDFKRDSSSDKTDHDILKEQHRFVWSEDDEVDSSWGKRLAKKYYDKLFKEYCIADLSCYKENKMALRWRVEKEVLTGKGQFICGNKKCDVTSELQSWEVNFAYLEHGEKKNALVKLRLCTECSQKLNFNHKRKLVKHKTKKSKKHHKKGKEKKSFHEKEESENSDKDLPKDKPSKDELDASLLETGERDIWSKPATIAVEKTREQEFDEYFTDMFL